MPYTKLLSQADYLKRELVSHSRKVCALYKLMRHDIRYHEKDFFETRFKQLVLRSKFDKNKNIKDLRVAKALFQQTQQDFIDNMMHPEHKYGPRPWHPFSKHGISADRNLLSPDYVLDSYDALERARYPYSFARREKMKDEYIALWNKKMLRSAGKDETTVASEKES